MAKTYEEMVSEAKSETEQIDVEQAHEESQSGVARILDVREPAEWEAGHIVGASLIPRGLLEHQADSQLPVKDARIILHCVAGGRGSLATQTLQRMGYTNVANMQGGINAWREKGYEVE